MPDNRNQQVARGKNASAEPELILGTESDEKVGETKKSLLSGEEITDAKVDHNGEPIEAVNEDKSEDEVADSSADVLKYVVRNHRITYDQQLENGKVVQHSWNDGAVITDDGKKIPSSQLRRLLKQGVVELKED